ncbi:MAG: hypothetical protein COA42_09670, partial [Alteromonadaceae bacterium]
LNGEPLSGVWRLRIADLAVEDDEGILNQWGISFVESVDCGPEPTVEPTATPTVTPTPTPVPTARPSTGGGGGGSASWFLLVLAGLLFMANTRSLQANKRVRPKADIRGGL